MSKPKTHIMIDTETLGIGFDSPVLTVGIVPFQFETEDLSFDSLLKSGLHLKISVEDQVKWHGLKIDSNTLEWWKGQSPESKSILKPSKHDLPLQDALGLITRFVKSVQVDGYVWSRGISFDLGRLHHLYAKVGQSAPWNYFIERDVRTMCDCLTGSTRGYVQTKQEHPHIKHNALHDAASDAFMMWEIYHTVMKGESYDEA